MKATAAGAFAGGLSTATVGSAQEDRGIPTPWLHVEGNEVRTENDEQVILRGVNVADPRRLDYTRPARGKGLLEAIDYVTDPAEGIGARIVRLPVHPGDIAKLTPIPHADVRVHDPVAFTQAELIEYCEEHLDDAIEYCKEIGVYCIVDFHRHWGSGALQWDDPTLSDEVELFWDTVAPRYSDQSHVIYELYNEPTAPDMGGTPLVNDWSLGIWNDWRDQAQPWLDTIREHADNLTIIGSPVWSQYPEGGVVAPFEGDDLGYTYHIYPGHSISDTNDWDGVIEDGTDEHNGEGVYECWKEVPLFVTEFGWQEESGYPMEGTTEGFGEPFFEWMDDKPIHWTAWCFDPTWLPAAVERPFETDDGDADAIGDPYTDEGIPQFCDDLPCDWELRGGSDMGELTAEILYEKRNDDVPGETDGPTTPASPSDQWTNEVGETAIEMEWEPVADATSYNVYLDGDHYAETTDETYVIEGLEPGTTYEIGIESENEAGTSIVSTTDVTTEDGESGTDEDPCEEVGAEAGAELENGDWVCDLDGDGNYRDLTVSGDTTTQDLQHFFENQHRDPWDSRTDLFDFTDNGDVGQPDVVDLFHSI